MSSSEANSNEEDNSEESSYYDSSDEESFDENTVGIALELPKRENRGKKYTKLVGEELEKDQQFWGHSTWDEDEVDDDYNCSEGEEQYAYSTDSDFDDPEDEDEEDEVDESQLKERKKKKYGAYVDPMLMANRRTLQAMSRKKPSTPKKQSIQQVKPTYSPEDFIRERRETTKQKTEAIRELEEVRKIKRKKVSSKSKQKKGRPPKVYTQEDLIEEAKRTEEANRKSLKRLQAWVKFAKFQFLQEDERKRYTESRRINYKGHYEIWISWNSLLSVVNPNKLDNEGNPVETISPHTEEKPLELYMFTTGKLPDYYAKAREDKTALESLELPKCTVTGQKAKYLDPLTKKYYSSVEAFGLLRQEYGRENLNALNNHCDEPDGSVNSKVKSEFSG